MKPFRYSRLTILAALAFAAACGGSDETLGPEERTGSLSFGYTGERAGVFAANGELRLGADNSIQTGSWAAALRDDANGLTIAAFQPSAGTRGTLFLVSLGAITQPTSVALACATGQSCSSGVAFNAIPAGPVTAADTTFALVSGSVVVDTLTSTRVAGRFSALGQFSATGNSDRDPTRTLSITDGRFSLPIRDDLD